MGKQSHLPLIHCCEHCQIYWTCEEKWYRGERNEENICCPLCTRYSTCLDQAIKSRK